MKEKTKSNIMTGASASAGAAVGVAAGVAFVSDMSAANTTNESSFGQLDDTTGGRYEPFNESTPTPSPEDMDVDEVTVVQGELESSGFPNSEYGQVGGVDNNVGGGGGSSSEDSDNSDYESDYGLVGNAGANEDPARVDIVHDNVQVDGPQYEDTADADPAPAQEASLDAEWADSDAPQNNEADDVEIFLSEDGDGVSAGNYDSEMEAMSNVAPYEADADDVEIFLDGPDGSKAMAEDVQEITLGESDVEPFADDAITEKGGGSCSGGEDDVDLEVLGCETVELDDGSAMDVATVSVDGDEAYIFDVDQDGTADIIAVDADGDGDFSDDEMEDISNDGIDMSEFSDGEFFGEDNPYEDTDMYSQGDADDIANSNDYVNDANVDDYIA